MKSVVQQTLSFSLWGITEFKFHLVLHFQQGTIFPVYRMYIHNGDIMINSFFYEQRVELFIAFV